MRTYIAALGIAFAPVANASPCHHYSTWNYPYPQPSCGRAAFASRNKAPIWYVEITSLPNDPPQSGGSFGEPPFTVVLAQHKDELNGLLNSDHLDGTKYYKKPWIAQCLAASVAQSHSSSESPDDALIKCETDWEKLAAPCINNGDTIVCNGSQSDPLQTKEENK